MKKQATKKQDTPVVDEASARRKREIRLSVLYLFILAMVLMQVYKNVYDPKLYLGGDNIIYYSNAKSIAQGTGYTNIQSPFNEPANHYPPGYAFVSAIVMKIFGYDIEVMNKANGFFLFGSLVFFFFIVRRLVKNIHLSFVIVMICALNAHLLNYSIIAMSEIPFLFTSMGAIFFLMRFRKDNLFYKDYNFWLFLLFFILSYYIRTAGLALIGGVILYFLFEKKWKLAVVITASFILCAFPWYLRNKALGGNSYVKMLFLKNIYKPQLGKMTTFSDWTERVGKNVSRYTSIEIPSGLLGYKIKNYNEMDKEKNTGAGIILLILGVAGLFFLKDYKWLIIAYMAGTVPILILWPELWYGPRFMLPVIPFMYLLAILPLYYLLQLLAKKINVKENVAYTVVPFLFLLILPAEKSGINKLMLDAKGMAPPSYQRLFEVSKWAKYNIPENSIVICRKPELFYIYSDRKSVNYIYTLNADSLLADMKNKGATHVVIEQLGFSSTRDYLFPTVQKFNEKFKLLKKTTAPETYLFEINYDMGYNGEMKDGKRDGKGICRYANGVVYDGEWKENVKNGEGTFIWPNGMKHIGMFERDMRNGPGKLYMKDGKYLDCIWVNDTANGYGKMYDSTGVLVREGLVKNNYFVNPNAK